MNYDDDHNHDDNDNDNKLLLGFRGPDSLKNILVNILVVNILAVFLFRWISKMSVARQRCNRSSCEVAAGARGPVADVFTILFFVTSNYAVPVTAKNAFFYKKE